MQSARRGGDAEKLADPELDARALDEPKQGAARRPIKMKRMRTARF
jgi:hypothetical protein